ncbi:MAG: hypothetical protein ABI548_07085 [Polyangiaceae bacterium]
MSASFYSATTAIEPAAKLSEVSPSDGIALLNDSDGLACVVTDPSASWGSGVDAAKLTIDKVRAYSGTNSIDALSRFVEEAAFQAESKLAEENPDADALFSGAIVAVKDNMFSWAAAGDLMIALCSVQNVVWLNGDLRAAGSDVVKLATKPATWYPGLLGCTRTQRSTNLLTPGGPVHLGTEQVVLILSQSVWSKLDDETIVSEARRAAARDRAWQVSVSESLLRIAKSRGAGGHRVAVGIYGAEQSPSATDPRSRASGYRALTVEEASETRIVVEECESEREVLTVEVLGVDSGVLTARFRNPTNDLNRATARGLVYELVLNGLFAGRFKNAAKTINYVDLDTGVATATAYGWPSQDQLISR